jgi:anti-sigma-K factor RskA
MTDPYVRLDAAYALGALDAQDTAAYEAHLLTCGDCRARVAQARSTLALLAGAGAGVGADAAGGSSVADVDIGAEEPPTTLLPALLRRARLERRHRTRLTAAVAGLAAACLIALGWVAWDTTRGGGPAQSRPVALTALHGARVQATAVLSSRPWGTQITVHCRYDYGVTGDRPYRLVVVDRAGHADDAGSWVLGPGEAVDYVGGTLVRREQIARVQVRLADGTPILQLVR